MSEKNINSEDKEVKESDFCKIKKIFTIDETHVDKIAVSKKRTIWYKYFIGYNDNDVIRSLCIKLPQMIGYVKCFDSNRTISFKVTDKNY